MAFKRALFVKAMCGSYLFMSLLHAFEPLPPFYAIDGTARSLHTQKYGGELQHLGRFVPVLKLDRVGGHSLLLDLCPTGVLSSLLVGTLVLRYACNS